ncbi:NLR family CARD domain-containing protein 3-like isoform X3 [Dysidea avara]|uniref:NLR family CARD domain-containing protein 3-like isoform X3 n=1 Tax=Dysidea avara TaxID=196820 RepID=UPI00332F68F6
MSVPSQKNLHLGTAPAAKTPIGQVYCSADNLRAKFLTPSDNEPKQLVTDYARLALVSNDHVTLNDEDLNEITRFTLKKAVDEVQMSKELLGELRDIFHHHDKPCPRLILIMGGPGIGKTTLVNEICMKWAKRDGFLDDDFDLVILIPSRSVQNKSLEEAVMEHIGEETYEKMKKSAGARSLIILDGWDEIPAACLDKDPFLTHHVKDGGTFPEATVLITSRPHACLTLEADRKIELVGFSEKEIQEFVQRPFSNDANLVDEFMQQFEKHAALCTICYVPKTLEMIVDLFQYSHGKLPEFLTKLYLQVIEMLVNKRVATKDLAVPTAMSSRNGEEVLRNVLVDIPEEAVGPVLLLSKMAYRGFFDWQNKVKVDNKNKDKKNVTIVPKVIFTVEDLVQSGINNPAQFDGYGLLITCDQVTYSFAHVAIQDLLCALYVSTLSEQEQYHLMSEYFHYFPTVFAYLCGLTGLKSSDLFQLVFSLLTGRQCERCILTAIHCLYESQHCNMPQSALPFSLSLGFQNLQPYDCLCISHVLLCYPVDQLRLGMCFMGDKGVKMLTTVYPKEDAGSSIQLLHLWRNDLTANGMEYIMKIVKASNATLTEIMIGGDNRFGDDVMPVMCKGLQHLCKLATLNIRQVCLTKKGAYFIGEFLKTYCVLETLDLSQNNVGDDGILAIADALLCNQTLTELWVGDCGVTVKGIPLDFDDGWQQVMLLLRLLI